jgi:hypothetical protein
MTTLQLQHRLAGYLDLQLRFAALMAERTGIALDDCALRYTNLHRRLGLGNGREQAAPAWSAYAVGLRACGTHAARLDWTQDFLQRTEPAVLPSNQTRFGCFSCEAPDEHGVLRFHFPPGDAFDSPGPLSTPKRAERGQELRALFAFARRAYPHARIVRGGSWLYHLEAYRRLFPPAYVATRRAPDGPVPIDGASTWGQFLDHRGGLRADRVRAFEAAWPGLDPQAPWRAFPLPLLRVEAPVGVFHAFYGS